MAEPKAKKAEEQAQQPAMPAGEKKVSDEATVQKAAPKEEATGKEADSELSEGASERTKTQFDKLKDKLSFWKDKAKKAESKVVPPLPKPRPEPEKPIYDPDTGLVNTEALNKLQQRAVGAEKKVQDLEGKFGTYISDSQEREAYGKYPELNPQAKEHDKELHVQTRRIAMDSMAYPETYGGRPLTMREAADVARKSTAKETPKEKEERTTVKEQATLEASGRPGQGVARQTSEEDYQRQRIATRRGDKDATIARMRAIREASKKK